VVTNVGYAHVEFFDSIEGIAAAKRELIEGLPAEWGGGAECRTTRGFRGFGEVHPGRSVTFGFSEGAEVRAEDVEYGAGGLRFRCMGVDFESAMSGRHAGDEPGGRDRRGARFRDRAGAAARGGGGLCGGQDARRTHGARRPSRSGNDCYNSNPEAAQSMLDC